jgi:mannose-6-phosphate isomerase-like protein (cupin superfamily)
VPAGARGVVLGPGGGERLDYCARPLTLWIKLDSATAPTTQLVAGVGEIRGDEGIGRHRGRHEVVYIRSGWGHAVFGADTSLLGPGSVVYVPPGVAHRFVSIGKTPLVYFWVIGPMSSGAGFRTAARIGCPGGPPAGAPTATPDTATSSAPRAIAIPATAGERIAYCDIPLVLTAKVDSESVAGTWLRAATGVLRRGSEEGVHRVDEVVLITHGRGRAFVGRDTMPVEPGSVMHAPRGMTHGFINDATEPLEYFIVYAGSVSREAFRRRAGRPGPYCPG